MLEEFFMWIIKPIMIFKKFNFSCYVNKKKKRATSVVSKTNLNLLCFIRVIDHVIQGRFVICFTYRRLTLSVPISNLLGDVTNGVRCHKPRQIAPLILNLISPNLFLFFLNFTIFLDDEVFKTWLTRLMHRLFYVGHVLGEFAINYHSWEMESSLVKVKAVFIGVSLCKEFLA